MTNTLLLLAQAQGSANPIGMVGMIAAMFAVMYFVMIRPQQKQAQKHKDMLSSLVKGDDVVTQGGFIGKIHAITDRVMTLEIANGVKVRVLKSAIQGKYVAAPETDAAAAKAEEPKKEER